MRRANLFATCLVALCLAFASTAFAGEARFRALLPDVRFGEIAHADARIQASFDSGQLTAQEAEFLTAILLARQSAFDQAEDRLRALLEQDPSRDLVRFELVRVLASQEKFANARFHLDRLDRPGLGADIRATYDKFDAELLALKPWAFQFGLSIEPSDNVNRGSTRTTTDIAGLPFTIDPQSRNQSGTRSALQLGAQRRFVLNERTRASVGGYLSYVHYDGVQDDTLEAGLSFGIRHAVRPQHILSATFGLGRQWQADAVYADSASATLAYSFPVSATTTQRVALSYRAQDFRNPATQDGGVATLSFQTRFAPDATKDLSLGLSLTRSTLYTAPDQYRGASARLSHGRLLRNGVHLSGGLDFGVREYDAVSPLFAKTRRDTFWSAEVAVTLGQFDIMGFAPRISARFEQQQSNINLYSFEALTGGLSLTRRF